MMASWGEVASVIDEEKFAAEIGAEFLADHFEAMWNRRLLHFEVTKPRDPREQVRWLRTMAKIACFDPPADDVEAAHRVWFRWLCQLGMWAIYNRLPDAAYRIRAAALSAPHYAPRCASAHYIADRLLESLTPTEFLASL